jgi:hypothetical protein
MLFAHAVALVEARSNIAALADLAGTLESSSAYERALVELDRLHSDDVPAIDALAVTEDRDTLLSAATTAVQRLADFGVDPLHVELLLSALAEARACDEP